MADRQLISSATERINLLNGRGEKIDAVKLIQRCRQEPKRMLADDEVGVVAYVGDLDIYVITGLGNPLTGEASPFPDGFWGKKVLEISIPRFSSQIVRRQIGSVVVSVTADSAFIIREGQKLRKVRGDNLKAGMVLESGESVYW